MNTLIFRTMAPALAAIMVAFSVIITLRGHNDPGGGFIGGLIAASGAAIHGMPLGVGATRKLLRVNPIGIAGLGVIIGGLSGFVSAFQGVPYLTGIWLPAHLFGTPGLFDIGVYFVVFGTLTSVVLALEDSGEGS
jgi:multicomponent Na+:H+ antiporter subunit B